MSALSTHGVYARSISKHARPMHSHLPGAYLYVYSEHLHLMPLCVLFIKQRMCFINEDRLARYLQSL